MKLTKVDYSFAGSYAELSDASGLKLNLVEQHLAEFINYGITAEEVAETKEWLENFRGFTADEEMVYQQVKITKRKDKTIDILRVAIRKLITKFNMAFAEDETNLIDLFNIENLSGISYKELLVKTRLLLNMYKKHITNGLGVENIDEIERLYKTLDKQTVELYELQIERKRQTNLRHAIANKLHRRVAKYCEVGKSIFIDTDNVMFESFNLYSNVWRKPTPEKTAKATMVVA